MEVKGWILDAYPGRLGEMVVWIKTPDDKAIRITDSWRNSIYVACDDIAGLEQLAEWAELQLQVSSCRYVRKKERIFDREQTYVLELILREANQAEKLAKDIERLETNHEYRLYNVDMLPAQKYFIEKNLFPLAKVTVEATKGTLQWTLLDNNMDEDYALPPIRKATLKVTPKCSRLLPTFNDPIGAVAITIEGRTVQAENQSETELLLWLVETIKELDPDILFIEKGDEFTTHYLVERACANNLLEKLLLGRDPVPLKRLSKRGTSYFAYGQVMHTPTSHQLYGRLNFDARKFFVFEESGLDGLFEVVRLCRIPLHKGSRATIGKCLSSMQAYVAFHDNLLIPWKPCRAEIPKSAKDLLIGDRGGFVYEPRVGVHEEVAEIDFTSLYPQIMIKHNISAETILCKCCSEPKEFVPDVGYGICHRQGVIPRSLEPIVEKRIAYKRKKKKTKDPELYNVYSSRVEALKGILVCSFGYLSYRNAKFGLIDCHIAVCAYARHILMETVRIAEGLGFEVLHGLIDSLWIKKPGADSEDYNRLCSEIYAQFGISVSFEGLYRWIAFLPSRQHDVSVMNSYFGVFIDGSTKKRGIELRREDTTRLVCHCQEEMLNLLSSTNSIVEVRTLVPQLVNIVRRYIERIKSGDIPIEDLIITNSLSRNAGDYKGTALPHIMAARQLAQEGVPLVAGQSISYVITNYDAKLSCQRVRPVQLLDSSIRYDRERYAELLLRGAATLLRPFGINESQLRAMVEDKMDAQLGTEPQTVLG